jgi:hypothetical protein
MNSPIIPNSSKNKSRRNNNRQNRKMHVLITYLVMSLFIAVVLFGLYTQNIWLLGIACFPVIDPAPRYV